MPSHTIETDLDILYTQANEKPALTIREIFAILTPKGRSILLIFLSIPFCQPIPLPGLSLLFGLIIFFLGIRIAFGTKIWMPNRILSKKISSATIKKIIRKTLPLMKKLRKLIRSRIPSLSTNRVMTYVNGLLIALLGLLLALPLPIPFTNIVVGWAIFLISFGLLENNGILLIAGYVVSLVTIALFGALLFSVKLVF